VHLYNTALKFKEQKVSKKLNLRTFSGHITQEIGMASHLKSQSPVSPQTSSGRIDQEEFTQDISECFLSALSSSSFSLQLSVLSIWQRSKSSRTMKNTLK
jgi:hypothetical protein